MSKALDYLLQVRSEAVGSYFKFLKEAGSHLDPKTHALLSVITKVDAQTETGLRQYLPRALQAGNRADEILDALLVCLPSLGMSKIIWAIDIILQMDIAEFNPAELDIDLMNKEKAWHELINVSELQDGVCRLQYAGRACFVSKNKECYQVFDSRCPHQATDIPHSALAGTILTCPKHQWQFDLQDGRCIAKGNRPLNALQFKIEAGILSVYS